MNPTTERNRFLTPVELALESAALRAMNMDALHTYGGDWPATVYWGKLVKGLVSMSALGAVRRAPGWTILWELFPDDADYLGLCGDGRGDLFAVSRDGALEVITFPALEPLV